MGLGDFLAGCLGVTEWGIRNGVEVDYRIEDHPMSKFYTYKSAGLPSRTEKVSDSICESYLNRFLNSTDEAIGISTNWNPYTEYSPLTLSKVRKILEANKIIKLKTAKLIQSLKDFKVLHIRLDDIQFLRPTNHAKTIQEYVKMNSLEGPFIVLSNNIDIKEELQLKEGWFIYESIPVHFGDVRFQEGDFEDTCVELEILKHAAHIYQFSVYTWPSNFSKRISELYTIPLTYIPIRNEAIDYYKQMGATFHYHNQ